MNLLKKENWWIWLMLAFMSGGSSTLVLGALLDVYDKDAWYFRWTKKFPKPVIVTIFVLVALTLIATTFSLAMFPDLTMDMENGVLGAIMLILSLAYSIIAFMIAIFQVQILAQVNAKLKTPGSEIYLSPYIWILCLIIPVLGWIMLIVMYLYLEFWYLVMLYRGTGE